jgi:hypothetical protein
MLGTGRCSTSGTGQSSATSPSCHTPSTRAFAPQVEPQCFGLQARRGAGLGASSAPSSARGSSRARCSASLNLDDPRYATRQSSPQVAWRNAARSRLRKLFSHSRPWTVPNRSTEDAETISQSSCDGPA